VPATVGVSFEPHFDALPPSSASQHQDASATSLSSNGAAAATSTTTSARSSSGGADRVRFRQNVRIAEAEVYLQMALRHTGIFVN